MKQFITLKLNPLQLEQINMGLSAKINVSLYNDPQYTWEHMECIRLLLQDGLDPAPILDITLSIDEWSQIAENLYSAVAEQL